MNNSKILNNKIINCKKCPRLIKFSKKISSEKKENKILMKLTGVNQFQDLEI